MPLHTIDPPMAAYDAVRSAMADLVAQNGFGTPALRRADLAAMALSSPQRTVVLGLDRIKGAEDLRSAAEDVRSVANDARAALAELKSLAARVRGATERQEEATRRMERRLQALDGG